VGLTLGTDAIGLSVKAMLSDRDALQVSFGLSPGTWAYWPRTGAWLAVDYLQHPSIIAESPHVKLGWELGVGATARATGSATRLDGAIGVTAIAGLELLLQDLPIDIVAAYRPGVLVVVSRPVGLAFAYGDIAVQVRWWF
jgi:hypothetical protein